MGRFTASAVGAMAALTLVACTANPEGSSGTADGETIVSAESGASPSPTNDSPQAPEYTRGRAQPYVPESEPSTENQSTAGSGCTPGTSDDLPDGVWRGFITEANEEAMEFDLICSWRFDSDTFRSEITQHDAEDGPILYVTQNDNPLERTLALAPQVQVWPQDLQGASWEIGVFLAQYENGGWDEAWVFINDGEVTEISQVYYP